MFVSSLLQPLHLPSIAGVIFVEQILLATTCVLKKITQMLKLTPFLSGKQRRGLRLVTPGVILRLQSSPLAFIGTKAEQKQKMTAHRYTTGTGASMRHRESSPTRPCLPTSRRVSDGGRHRPIGSSSSSWGIRTRTALGQSRQRV